PEVARLNRIEEKRPVVAHGPYVKLIRVVEARQVACEQQVLKWAWRLRAGIIDQFHPAGFDRGLKPVNIRLRKRIARNDNGVLRAPALQRLGVLPQYSDVLRRIRLP